MLKLNEIYCGDCLKVMKDIDDKSIDMVLTSPPYDNLRSYEGFVFNFEMVAKELYRIIKDGGVVVWVVGDATRKGSETGTSFKQALYFKECGFNLHDTMIYQKASPPIIPTVRRYQPNFEYMFVLTKGKINTFNPIRIPCLYPDKRTNRSMHRKQNGEAVVSNTIKPKLNKIKENVWHYAVSGGNLTKNKINHPAMFAEKLAEDHIISWSNEGDTILDPMAGSGTTLKMAKKNGRNYIGIEISEKYCSIARERLRQGNLL